METNVNSGGLSHEPKMAVVPRAHGLKDIVDVAINSSAPLRDLFARFGNRLMEELTLQIFHMGRMSIGELVEHCNRTDMEYPENSNALVFPSKRIRKGEDYLGLPEEMLRNSFCFGGINYFYCDTDMNSYNPSFMIAVYPRETISCRQKSDMITDFTWRKDLVPGRMPVKSILFEHENNHYLAVVPGSKKVDFISIGRQLGLSRSQSKRLGPAQSDPNEIIGRESGAVGLLMHPLGMQRIKGIFVDSELKTPYSKPYYDIPLDKRSALVVSDMDDLFCVLAQHANYPLIHLFEAQK